VYELIGKYKLKNVVNASGELMALLRVHLVCDFEADIPEPLPHWASGSVCEVLEDDRKIYKLSNNREWIEVSVSSHDDDDDDDSHKKSKLIIGGVCLAGKPDFDEEQIQKLLEQMDYDGSEVIILD